MNNLTSLELHSLAPQTQFLSETLFTGFQPYFLDFFSFAAILSGILVIITLNPVISIFYLIALFVNVACYLMLIGVNFLGLVYILVYVGAIAILFLFIVMLLNIKLADLYTKNSHIFPLGTIIGMMFLYPIYSILPSNSTEIPNFLNSVFIWFNSILTNFTPSSSHTGFNTNELDNLRIENVFSTNWDSNIFAYSQISSIGNIMYTDYAIWLILVSLILLLAMIGAIVLTLKPVDQKI